MMDALEEAQIMNRPDPLKEVGMMTAENAAAKARRLIEADTSSPMSAERRRRLRNTILIGLGSVALILFGNAAVQDSLSREDREVPVDTVTFSQGTLDAEQNGDDFYSKSIAEKDRILTELGLPTTTIADDDVRFAVNEGLKQVPKDQDTGIRTWDTSDEFKFEIDSFSGPSTLGQTQFTAEFNPVDDEPDVSAPTEH